MASSSTNSDRPEIEVMGAFHEVAPSASTSGTSSTLIRKPSYDVFINHRGPDVKQTLASSIYKILGDMKVSAFLDSEELEYGDFLPATLEAVIRGATLQIAIFSRNYAESPWCLAELSCMLKSGAKIVPVFYYVEPTDVRYVAQRKGIYADAFERHKKKRRYSPEKLKDWENALHKVSFYSGEIIKNNEDEMKLFKNIVNIVLKEIRNVPLMVAKHPVGLSKIIEDFENTLPLVQCDQGAQIVGIWGMGGSGKTTLAKELYNRKSSFMERSSFIFDIREAKEKLYKKQIQLLKDSGLNQTFDNIEQGKANLASPLRSFRVLIVMDDVDHTDQLDALLPPKESLVSGSLIIVTTRECEVLTSWGTSSVYKMRALDPSNAEQLFCWHAFLQPSPLDGFEKLVKMFIEACDGLPLSLKVFGGQLYGKCEKQYWESLFQKISRILPTDIKGKLKVSYDVLDDEDKEAFLDTACFLIGERNSLAIEFWEGSWWSGLYTWQRLLNKCLVEVDHKNCIRMHDHLRDLGMEIANRHSLTRLWLPQQIIDYDKETKKRNGIRGIKAVALENKELSYKEELLLLAPSLVGLKLLVIRGDYFKQVIGEVPRELVWLCWFNIGQRNLPTWLSLKNLRVLQLSEHFGIQEHHLEELWKAESDAPLQLRELVISNCYKFQRFPNSIGCLSELKKIVITGRGNNIRSLPEEFCHLQLLEHLELHCCEMLSSLPSNFGNLRNMRYLDLSRCTELKSLPVSFKNLILLQYLSLEMCTKLILRSDDLQNITKLEFLSLFGCEQLEELPRHMTNQVSLRELYLGGRKRLRDLPIEIGQLSRLRKMRIGGHFISLPNSLGDLSSLADLSISDSTNLESLPTSLGDLSSLIHLSIRYCDNLESLPTSVGDLSFLTNLAICGCSKLKWLPSSIGHLNHLEHLEISECSISQVDFGAASLSFALNNLKWMELKQTEVCRISLMTVFPAFRHWNWTVIVI